MLWRSNTERVLLACIATRIGNASAYEIPNGGASEVVRNATRRSGFFACLSPGLRETSDSLAFDVLASTVEHPGAENLFDLQSVALGRRLEGLLHRII
jgi:hypothetical protein